MSFGPYAVGVAFWIFVAVATVAGIVGDYKKRKLALEPLKAAIERGQQLDPAIIEKLMGSDQRMDEEQPENLQIAGTITIASGIGLGLFAFFIERIVAAAFYAVLGVGVVAICVGIGLLIAAKQMARNRVARQS